jgi:hypothetical protein
MIDLLQFKDGVVTVPRDSFAWRKYSVVGLVTVSFGNWFYSMEGIGTGERMEIRSPVISAISRNWLKTKQARSSVG